MYSVSLPHTQNKLRLSHKISSAYHTSDVTNYPALLIYDIYIIIGVPQEADSDPTGETAQKTQQMLTYYELDLGLNHVVRKYSEHLEEHANFLITGIRII